MLFNEIFWYDELSDKLLKQLKKLVKDHVKKMKQSIFLDKFMSHAEAFDILKLDQQSTTEVKLQEQYAKLKRESDPEHCRFFCDKGTRALSSHKECVSSCEDRYTQRNNAIDEAFYVLAKKMK